MTDTTASSASPQPNGQDWLSGFTDAPDAAPASASPPASERGQPEWNVVSFPGHLPLADPPELATGPETEPLGAVFTSATDGVPQAPQAVFADPQSELPESVTPAPEDVIQLIQDLNQCNDALLLRVSELEEALERSQVALQAEIERHQAPAPPPLPAPVQHQIAQLLSELDIANDGLRRTTIHNETLQAELDTTQQRVAHLERECTLLQQRFSEKSTALQQAEETCRDLKTRLQRQQRYTLQFKAALEKCLAMAPGSTADLPAGTAGALATARQGAPGEARGEAMPLGALRSQQIQPWSVAGDGEAPPPNLNQILRGLRGTPVVPAPAPAPAAVDLSLPQADPWLESPAAAAAPPAAAVVAVPPAVEQAPAAAVFTEPSPWGEPLLQPDPVAVAAPHPEPMLAPEPEVPAYLTTAPQTTPSPLVYPLRSPKKIKSIAAVELPTFGRSTRRP